MRATPAWFLIESFLVTSDAIPTDLVQPIIFAD
jgi:hypothetical protein